MLPYMRASGIWSTCTRQANAREKTRVIIVRGEAFFLLFNSTDNALDWLVWQRFSEGDQEQHDFYAIQELLLWPQTGNKTTKAYNINYEPQKKQNNIVTIVIFKIKLLESHCIFHYQLWNLKDNAFSRNRSVIYFYFRSNKYDLCTTPEYRNLSCFTQISINEIIFTGKLTCVC